MIQIPADVEKFFNTQKVNAIAVLDGEIKVEQTGYYRSSYKYFAPSKFRCACEESKQQIQDVPNPESRAGIKCAFCGSYAYSSNQFCTKKVEEKIKQTRTYYHETKSISSGTIVYLRPLKDKVGIEIYVGSIVISPKEENDDISFVRTVNIKNYVKVVPGEPLVSLRILKRSNKPVDIFEALNINSQTVHNYPLNIEGYYDFWEYFNENKKFMSRIGFMEALSSVKDYHEISALFILHLALVSTYPVLELLVKMKYFSLYNGVIKTVQTSGSKASIVDQVKNLNKLLNDTTKGSLALKIPKYIGDYLNERAYDLNEFQNWSDIYELENLSKENFEKIISSTEFFFMNTERALHELPNIMKYGYPIEKLIKYLYKESKGENGRRKRDVARLLSDYLRMCEMMEVTPDPYPVNIHSAHDTMAKAYHAQEDAMKDNTLAKIADAVSKAIAPKTREKATKMEELYDIVIPKSCKDFIEEGNMQHNCVGHYTYNVLKGNCIIFFIRKKEDPTESFITAECPVGNYRGQLMYKNNRPVTDKDLVNYHNVICNKIRGAISRKEIPGF